MFLLPCTPLGEAPGYSPTWLFPFSRSSPPPSPAKKNKNWNSMKFVPKYNWALKLLMGLIQLNLCLSFEIGVGWVDSNELLSILGT
jgi:hypothetical protein